jgi:hypothetical protein
LSSPTTLSFLLVPALDDLPDLLEETQVGPLRFVAVDAPQVVAGQLVNDGLVAQFVELEAHRLAVCRDGGAERGFDRQAGGVEAIIGRAGEVGGKVVAVGLQAVANQVGEADFEAVALTQRAQRGVFGRLGTWLLWPALNSLKGMPMMCAYSGGNLPVFGSTKVVAAAQRPAGDLFAQELRAEGAQAHDVGDGVGVPAFAEHGDGDHATNVRAERVGFADGVDHFTLRVVEFGIPALGAWQVAVVRFVIDHQ